MSATGPIRGAAEGELTRRIHISRRVDALLLAAAAAALGAGAWFATRSLPAGAVAAVVCAAILLSRSSADDAARRLERLDPALDGAVTAFAEGGGGRLREPLAAWVMERRPRATHRRALSLLAAGCAAAGLAAAARPLLARRSVPAARTAATRSASRPGAPSLRVDVTVTPPAYAGLPVKRFESPSRPIEALKGSVAEITVQSQLPAVEVAEEGKDARSVPLTSGEARWSLPLSKTTAVRIGGGAVVSFEVVPDRAPDVELTLPREDRTVSTAPGPLDVAAEARDDIGLASLDLHYTLAHGHGEGMTFKSGRIAGPRAPGATASIATRLDASALGLGKGDTLVVWAEASDGNAVDGPSRSASSVRILRFEEDLARIQMKSSAPAVRPLNGPLSQREILARTLRLLAERPPKERLAERSRDLAEEQGKLRAAFSLFLRAEEGNAEELDVETKEEAEIGVRKQQKLLEAAVSAMWGSEGELAMGNPAGSVPHQKLALKRLDEAFGNERYALRALAPPKAPVDEARRLKGDAKGLAPRAKPDPLDETRLDPAAAARLTSLARRLILFSEGLAPSTSARALADELWRLPELAGLSRSTLAAPLYASQAREEESRAARLAADALLRLLDPHPPTRPAVSPEEPALFTRLGASQAR